MAIEKNQNSLNKLLTYHENSDTIISTKKQAIVFQ